MNDENEIARSLGRLEGKVDLLIDMHSGTSKRVGAVEKRVWWATGAMGVVAFVIGKIGISSFLGH